MAPAPAHCAEREKIAEAIRTVLREILALHSAKVGAQGDRLSRIEKHIENATARESSLREIFQRHVQAHGCQPPTAVE